MSEDRYSRQVVLPEIGPEGQRRLGQATAVVIGCGALGGVVAELLARAGVGRLRLADRDIVERQNLQRQLLFDETHAEAALPKAEAAARRLATVNSDIVVEPHITDVHAGNVEALLADADVVLDGTDNFETRYLLNDACVKHGLPWFYGGVVGTGGLALAIIPDSGEAPGSSQGPCLRCLFPEPPAPGTTPTCDTAGVLNAGPAVIGAVQVAAALQYLVDPSSLVPRLLSVDLWRGSFRTAQVQRDPACACCGAGNYEFLSRKRGSWTTTLCGRNAVQITPDSEPSGSLEALAERLQSHGRVTFNGLLLKLETDAHTLLIFPDGRTLVQGTDDEAVARTLYARFIGG